MRGLALQTSHFGAAAAMAALTVADAASAVAGPRDREAMGIWKVVAPLVPMRGEFGSYNPIGLASGAWVKADCSLNWTDPDDRKLYCFLSATSPNWFLEWPKTNEQRARDAFLKGATR